MRPFRLGVLTAALFAAVMMTTVGQAADWRPSGNMTFYVASGPGGAHDLLARFVAKHWKEQFGVSAIVQNVKGAGGTLGWDKVARAKPNGQIIGFSSSSPYLRLLSKQRFKWNLDDLPVVLGIRTPPVMVVTGAKSEFKTWQDVRNAKRKVRFGVPGSLSMEITSLIDLTKHNVEMTTASFGGSGATIPPLESGVVDLHVTLASVIIGSHVKSGRLRTLLVINDKRLPEYPDVPTHLELGMPANFTDAVLKRLWIAPIGTPKPILDSLAKGLRAILNKPDVAKWSHANGMVRGLMAGEDAKKSLNSFHKINVDNAALFKKYGG